MFGVFELFLHSFTMQYLILVEIIRSWCNRRSFVYVFRTASATVYCTVKQLTNDRRAEICARLQWQGCTGTFTMIVSDEQLHFYRLCGTSMYSNVLGKLIGRPADSDSISDQWSKVPNIAIFRKKFWNGLNQNIDQSADIWSKPSKDRNFLRKKIKDLNLDLEFLRHPRNKCRNSIWYLVEGGWRGCGRM